MLGALVTNLMAPNLPSHDSPSTLMGIHTSFLRNKCRTYLSLSIGSSKTIPAGSTIEVSGIFSIFLQLMLPPALRAFGRTRFCSRFLIDFPFRRTRFRFSGFRGFPFFLPYPFFFSSLAALPFVLSAPVGPFFVGPFGRLFHAIPFLCFFALVSFSSLRPTTSFPPPSRVRFLILFFFSFGSNTDFLRGRVIGVLTASAVKDTRKFVTPTSVPALATSGANATGALHLATASVLLLSLRLHEFAVFSERAQQARFGARSEILKLKFNSMKPSKLNLLVINIFHC